MKALYRNIAQILRNRRIRRVFTGVISVVSAVIVFFTTYATVLPAITMEKTASCGIEEHQHSDNCYEERLICGQEESEGHQHDDSCYTVTKELVCQVEEHKHSKENGCYDEEGNLICKLPEHVHDDSCYKEVKTLTCGLEESEGHHHTDACYEKVLVCGKEVHTHSAECYKENDSADESDEEGADSSSDTVPQDSASGSNSTKVIDSSEDSNVSTAEDADETQTDASVDTGTEEAADAAADTSTEEAADAATDTSAEELPQENYVPALDPLNMDAMLNKHTDFYYFHAEDGEDVPSDSAAITDWKKVEADTELASTDMVKMYLSYSIPAGSLNETNPTARYRLPGNIHLTDEQMKAINKNENGFYAGYVESDSAKDAKKYLGAEAVEGDRKPDEQLKDGAEEYISAVVRVEKTDDGSQELIFTFIPYTIEKNQKTYDPERNLVSAGEKVTGWFTCDFNLGQIDWEEEEITRETASAETEFSEAAKDNDADSSGSSGEESEEKTIVKTVEKTAEIIFAKEDKEEDIEEISCTLKCVEKEADASAEESAGSEDSEDSSELSSEETGGETSEAEQEYKAGTLTADGDGYKITLDYTEEAKIPENASLSVREITADTDKEAYEACLAQAQQHVDESGETKSSVDSNMSRFFDIEILVTDADGNSQKIEPAALVSVNIQIFDVTADSSESVSGTAETQQSDPTVLHFADEGVEQVDSTATTTDAAAENENTDSNNGSNADSGKSTGSGSEGGEATKIQFEAESFSIYGVVYTVDFHWEVNGKTYDFSLPGGGFVSLRTLMEVLGVAHDDAQDDSADSQTGNIGEDAAEEAQSADDLILDDIRISEATKEFVSDIADVEFSSPDLVWVGKAEDGTTVENLKKANDLNCRYSAELTQEQIAEINAQTVEAGDWALISVQPFESKESLALTMTNGDRFTVKVTDGQLHKYVISDAGDAYEVIVTYDDAAGIPRDAELVVEEISADSEKYADNIRQVNKELSSKKKSEVTHPVQFDIRIVSDGKKIEPKEGSTVNVEVKLARTLFTADSEKKKDESRKEDAVSEEEPGYILINGQLINMDEGEITGCTVAHIKDDGSAEIIGEVQNSVTEDEIVMQFDTDSFSDYMFDGNSGSQLNNLPSTIYVGDVIYMWHQGDYWVDNINSVVTETKHNNDDKFKVIKAINTGKFRIYHKNYGSSLYKEITVLQARTGTTPPRVLTADDGIISNDSIGLKLNLFDYDLDDYLDDRFNNYDYGDNPTNVFLNHGINNGHSLKFWGSGIGANHGALNQYKEHGVTNIVESNLSGGTGGYPKLKGYNETLEYLFAPSNGTDKTAYTNADGLFRKVDDYYVYDSDQNYAYYDSGSNKFLVYDGTYKQKSRKDGGEQSQTTSDKAIGFFPFHPWDDDYDLYVNWNKKLNHHFGMSMSVDFALPQDPKAVKDTNGNDIVYSFSGDDDMWVFIDGKLAMDIGGIHQPTTGTINFTKKTVVVNGSNQSGFNFDSLYDGKTHTLQVFYIERGGCDSNCRIQFNITRYGDAEFDKVDDEDNAKLLKGAIFGLYKDANCTTPLMENLKDGTSRAYIDESDENGHVSFTGISLGTYYLKEIWAPEGYPLDPAVHTVVVFLDPNGRVKARVSIDGIDAESPGVKITNKHPDPITLGLKKEWQNTDGEAISVPDGASATFELKRIRTYETYTEQVVEGESKNVSKLTVGWIHNGETHTYKEYSLVSGTQATISWGYKNGYSGDIGYVYNGTAYSKDSVPTNIYSQAITMPGANGTATFYVIDNSEQGNSVSNINVAGSEFLGNSGGGIIHTFETFSEPDPSFTYTDANVTNNRVTLPINNSWEYSFTNLPLVGQDEDHIYTYSYYLEEVSAQSPAGTTVVYKDTAGNVINTPTAAETSQSGTLNIANKVPTGYLQINKSVTFNGVEPATAAQKSALAGTYTFKVYTDSNCSKPYKVIQGEGDNQQEVDLTLTVTIGDDGTAKSSDVVKVPVGDYWIEEQTPSQSGVTPEANRIAVTVTADNTSSEPAITSFTNNKEESDSPDELAIELEKTFTGLPDAGRIPSDFCAVLTYSVPGGSAPVTVQLTGSTQGNVTCTKSNDGMTWHWRVTRIPANATDFGVSENNYDITGYTRITKINGNVVDNPANPQGVNVLIPQITMTNVTSAYTTPDKYKVFDMNDNQVLFIRMTSQATVIVSRKSLSLAERTAIEKAITDNHNKIPGDDHAQATWVPTFVYFSHETQGDSFSYGGRTVYFDGDKVKIPHKSSSQEARVDINFVTETAENSFTIENDYTEISTELDVLKVEAGKETSTRLKGAVFELRQLVDEAPTSGGTLTYVKDDNQKEIVTSKTTGEDGRLTYSGLTYGYYEIREVTAPPGYVLPEKVIFYLKVDAGTVTYLQKGTGKPSTWIAASNDNATVKYLEAQSAVEDDLSTPEDETAAAVNTTFRVTNEPGAELPSTGGPGIRFFTILGSMLIAFAGAMFLRRHQQR